MPYYLVYKYLKITIFVLYCRHTTYTNKFHICVSAGVCVCACEHIHTNSIQQKLCTAASRDRDREERFIYIHILNETHSRTFANCGGGSQTFHWNLSFRVYSNEIYANARSRIEQARSVNVCMYIPTRKHSIPIRASLL